MLATYLFAFQIYCDFSGYTDIAIGAAQMMGYTFRPNFRSPYLAQNIQDFWSRWHISLSTWFRDYVYVPLGGSAVAASRWAFNIAVVFLISGLWHGANWTFVVWGGLHAAYYLIYRGYRRMRSGRRSASLASGSVSHALSVAVTFHAVLVAWVFFRAASLAAAVGILTRMLPGGWRTAPADIVGFGRFDLIVGVMAIAFLMTVEILQGHDLRQILAQRPRPMRWGFYYAVVLLIVNFGMFHNPQQFIYFQF
jgi:D-alanyl-lipoteichoic acid acyltransferase DltB (MBOAT superfamily)